MALTHNLRNLQGIIASSPGSRLKRFGDKWPRWGDAATPQTRAAVAAYARIAQEAGLTPAQLALLWCRTRPCVQAHGSVIVGASSVEQLEENLAAFDLPCETLTQAMCEEIDAVHLACRDPSDTL